MASAGPTFVCFRLLVDFAFLGFWFLFALLWVRFPALSHQASALSFPNDSLTAVNVTCKCAFPLPVALFHPL